jgi:hypothetical protein
MHRISFGKKSTNNTLIHGDGIAGAASSSSASLDCPVDSAHVSETGDEIVISSGTKRTHSVINSDDDHESEDDENNTSSSTISTKSKVDIFVF